MNREELREEIANTLYSVQNEQGNSHLFTTDLCDDVVDEIIKLIDEPSEPFAPALIAERYEGIEPEIQYNERDGMFTFTVGDNKALIVYADVGQMYFDDHLLFLPKTFQDFEWLLKQCGTELTLKEG